MKRFFTLALMAMIMTSCYSTRIMIGDVQPNEPTIKVNSKMNHYLIAGLAPVGNTHISSEEAKEYVGNAENYVIKNSITFVDGLISFITWGIYTPTHLEFYVPMSDIQSK